MTSTEDASLLHLFIHLIFNTFHTSHSCTLSLPHSGIPTHCLHILQDTSSFTHCIFSSYRSTLSSYSLHVTTSSQNAAFDPLHYSIIHSFTFTGHAKPFIIFSPSILLTPQAPFLSLTFTAWILPSNFDSRSVSHLHMSLLVLLCCHAGFFSYYYIPPCLVTFLSLYALKILPLSCLEKLPRISPTTLSRLRWIEPGFLYLLIHHFHYFVYLVWRAAPDTALTL